LKGACPFQTYPAPAFWEVLERGAATSHIPSPILQEGSKGRIPLAKNSPDIAGKLEGAEPLRKKTLPLLLIGEGDKGDEVL